jgi:hypothetical protein
LMLFRLLAPLSHTSSYLMTLSLNNENFKN